MKFLIIGLFFFGIFFGSCTNINHISGTYTNVFKGIMGSEIRFLQTPDSFKYYLRTEGSVKDYSAGSWIKMKNKIILEGFNNNNINLIAVESTFENYPSYNQDMVVIRYRPKQLDVFTKVDVIINEDKRIRVSGDTVFFSAKKINNIRVVSFYNHDGLLLFNPERIDTLSSSKITMSVNNYKRIALNFSIKPEDFYRIKLLDTLTIKNNKILLWGNRKMKKVI